MEGEIREAGCRLGRLPGWRRSTVWEQRGGPEALREKQRSIGKGRGKVKPESMEGPSLGLAEGRGSARGGGTSFEQVHRHMRFKKGMVWWGVWALAGLGCGAGRVSGAGAGDRPNVLLIVSDDHGYADVGFHGCKDIPTPHLDRLAAEGVRCTRGYVTHPYCSPTRAGLLTGRYQQRFGHENNPFYDPADEREGLPLGEKLLPEYLRGSGYVTGWVGKWHLGAAPAFKPENRGFMETFGFVGGGHRFLGWKPDAAVEYQVPLERNGKAEAVEGHLTTVFGNEAAAFIRRHRAEPWFLYLAFNAPHTPHEPTAERLARFSGIQDPKRRKYAAQVSLMDDAIGEALGALRETDQQRRTLVFFFSDNGGPIGETGNGSENTPLRGGKGSMFEGGVRVPFVVSWPGRLREGVTYDPMVSSLDVFATALACAGVPLPADRKLDGVDLLPYLGGTKSGEPHERLFWRSGPQLAVIDGDSKLIRQGKQPVRRYDLAKDVAESRDLAAANEDEVARLGSLLDAWNGELVPPAFPGGAGRKGGAVKAAPKAGKGAPKAVKPGPREGATR